MSQNKNRRKRAEWKTLNGQQKFVRAFWTVVLSGVALMFTMLLLTAMGVFGKLPSFEELENPKSNIATEIYSEDGEMIGSFFVENRSFVDFDDLPPSLVAAAISTEDSRFYSHSGIDMISLVRVGIRTLAMGDKKQGGGSTITQQLAKNLFPRESNARRSKAKLVIAKFKEWITAVKLEYNYTKDEILAMYLNIVSYGSNAYGIRSASQTFFGKEPGQLDIQEGAVLVGVVNAPSLYSPVRNYDNALRRRNVVLSRMKVKGFIDRQQLDSLKMLPIELDYSPVSNNEGIATYFREMIRTVMKMPKPKRNQYANEWDYKQDMERWENNPLYGWCNKNLKADGSEYNLSRDGLRIYTTINAKMQRYAEEALEAQMRDNIQPRMEATYKATKVLFKNTSKEDVEKIIRHAMRYSDRYRAMKAADATDAEIEEAFNKPAEMRVFSYKGDIDTLMTPRDSILYHKRILRAAFMAMDPNSGYVKAYVGGPDYRYFKYDMVKQGKRQVGSTIKPFIYTFAIDHMGMNPCTLVPNLPTTIETYTGDAWTPKESGTVEYDGVLHPLKWGLARSRNNYSAWIMKQAKQPRAVADFIHSMGIRSYIDPVDALCLGTPDVSLFEMVGAYSTFVNKGVFTEPVFVVRIEDRHGNVLSTFGPSTSVAISEQTAYTMLGMLKNVVNSGTAIRLRNTYNIYGDVGGKTGTSQDNRDAWFMCVTPKIVCGAWVGGEDQSVHLNSQGEGSVVALPIVGEFLKRVHRNSSLGVSLEDKFFYPLGAVDYNCVDSVEPDFTQDEEDEFFL